jgi:phage repressor protein C with HTH and peptisase S24 domain
MFGTGFDEVMARIERKLDQHGMTDREASLKAVGKPDLIRDMKRRRGLPTSERLSRLANLLGTTTDWLLNGGLEGPILDRATLNPDGTIKSERDPAPSASDVRSTWPGPAPHKPVPLVGSAFGGEWEAGIELTELRFSEVLDYLARPPFLQMDAESYALEIVGDSISPRFEPGERAFVSPLSPVRIGDDVVVQLNSLGEEPASGTTMALIKRLTKRSPAFVELRQFNPDLTFRVPMDRVSTVHRVRARY